MAQGTVTLTLNNSANTNVSYTLATSDFPDAVTFTSTFMKNGGLWVGSVFYPSSAVLYVTIS